MTYKDSKRRFLDIMDYELSEEAKRGISLAELDIKEGRIHKWEDVKKELHIDV